ncbi:haloalkane dehalogenase [Actinopolyspora erythraea]|uniref:Haloalkane dehalogenase n=1 Tax=Actinopolyspora erythraea TaxID=414996 RepID=A0A099D914_9ACTN|nr:haloalkane dehalogenase [Actinopolyspora erythraea]ASU80230.1 haloalkane dehalogenase [Actinopolyspora erythraea]KGI82406.1 haloalkane dehalogenase [Actinopolyspora erythraea]
MRVLTTPEERFEALPGFQYRPHRVELSDQDGGTLRMAYVTDGPADGPVVLLLHGEPSWSFLYREVMAVLAEAGIRAVAPDLVGFGRSDKPTRQSDHSYARHVEWLRQFAFDVLDLREVTLVGQDWGGLLGLRLLAEHPERFSGAVAANTGMPTGDHNMPEVWWDFHRAVEKAETLDVGRLVASGCVRPMSEEVRAAYDAPFPDESHKAGPRVMPKLVPTTPDDPATEANRAAWRALASSTTPLLTAFSDSDPVTASMGPVLRKTLPGAAGQRHATIAEAGHFLQEDAGAELGRVISEFVRPSR